MKPTSTELPLARARLWREWARKTMRDCAAANDSLEMARSMMAGGSGR
jgi:hypothetical protein